MKIAIVANSAWYLFNFRLQLGRRLRERGHEVFFVAPSDKYVEALKREGFDVLDWPLAGAGKHPWRESKAVLALRRIFKDVRPTHVFSYTPKANIYCGLALTGLPVRFFPNVSGLGRLFIRRSLLTHVATALYKAAFRRSEAIIFQNGDDLEVFRSLGITKGRETVTVPGSGVDLKKFLPSPLPSMTRPVRQFLFVGRLLGDKGIVEYVEAAAAIRMSRDDCEFVVVGSTQSENPAAIPISTVDEWTRRGIIRHVEHVEDIRPLLEDADCVVLPSYREGVPRSLLEAAAVGRPIITTDAPGCKEVVRHGETGMMCRARDASALESAIRDMLALDAQTWAGMGQKGRAYMEQRFSEEFVLSTYETFCSTEAAANTGPRS
jgi:glycosyltransferase involved in cell wall biosynthesis